MNKLHVARLENGCFNGRSCAPVYGTSVALHERNAALDAAKLRCTPAKRRCKALATEETRHPSDALRLGLAASGEDLQLTRDRRLEANKHGLTDAFHLFISHPHPRQTVAAALWSRLLKALFISWAVSTKTDPKLAAARRPSGKPSCCRTARNSWARGNTAHAERATLTALASLSPHYLGPQ